MRKVYVIGMGAGDPEYVTVQAIRALNAVGVFFLLDKGEAKRGLNELRREICSRYIDGDGYRTVELEDPVRDPSIVDYTERVEQWHLERVALVAAALERELGEDGVGGFLVWGDPSLYDSTLRILEQVGRRIELAYELIPGITSVQALAARHRVMLNGIGESVLITTGRKLVGSHDAENVVVMLDGQAGFKGLTDSEQEIFWGAYLGMPEEMLVSGLVGEVAEEIERLRADGRRRNGWVMDTYLLRGRRLRE